jgi:glycosyltransferase involved in cell wall biosynthesis
MAEPRRTVLHYVPRWLPLSEQYVDQLLRGSVHQPVVAVRRGVLNLGAFPQSRLVRLDRILAPVPRRLQRQATGAALALTLRRHRADLLHVHFGFEVDGVVGAARRAGVPLVVSVHGNDVTSARTDTPAQRRALSLADAVVVPSAFLAEHAVRRGARPDRIHVVPSGVELSAHPVQPWPSGPPTAVFIGRFVEKKGLDVLAEAWPAVLAQVPEARLLVLGEGPVPPPAGAERWPPDPSRRLEQVREALGRAAVVVTPSRTAADGDSESLLLVNLEAQASGRAVVTTRHGGIPEFVDERTAVLVPEGDAPALAHAVARLLADPATAQEMGRVGPSVAARFSAEAGAAGVDAVYADLLRNTHH